MDILKDKAQKFNVTKNNIGKKNTQLAINEFKKLDEERKTLLNISKNIWHPLPEMGEKEVVFESESKNEDEAMIRRTDLNINTVLAVKIFLPKEDKLSNNILFNVSLKFKNETVGSVIKRVRGTEIECQFDVDSKMMKLPASMYLCIQTKKKRMLCCKPLTLAEDQSYSLANLKRDSEIKKAFKVDKSKIEIFARFKKNEEEGSNINLKSSDSVKVLTILDEREPFVNVEMEILEQSVDNKISRFSDKNNMKVKTNIIENNNKIPEGLDKEEIEDPDVVKNLASLLYCTKKLMKFNLAVQNSIKNSTGISKALKDKVMMFQRKKIEIENAISNEEITSEEYLESLSKSLAHDQILLKYFLSIKDEIKANVVKFRIECTQKEINNDVDEDEVDNDE